jgi:hypothetical protein
MLRSFARSGAILLLAVACSAQQPSTPASSSTTLSPDLSVPSYCRSLLPRGQEASALEGACNFALELSQHMPNFTCEMKVEKYEDINSTFRSTQYMQKIEARARYVNGKDSYDDLRINSRPVADSSALIQGTWSFGEFGIKLLAAFAPKDHPSFKFTRSTNVNGFDAYEYEFRVHQKNNRMWRWIWEKKSTLPGYSGKIWIAKRDGRILRLHLTSNEGVPEDFPIHAVESKTEYSFVDFKDGSGFVLPSKAQINTWMNDKRLIRTKMSFTKCQRFRVDSHIILPPPSE